MTLRRSNSLPGSLAPSQGSSGAALSPLIVDPATIAIDDTSDLDPMDAPNLDETSSPPQIAAPMILDDTSQNLLGRVLLQLASTLDGPRPTTSSTTQPAPTDITSAPTLSTTTVGTKLGQAPSLTPVDGRASIPDRSAKYNP